MTPIDTLPQTTVESEVKETPASFKLTREERLELENLELKARILRLQLDSIAVERQQWVSRLSDRVGLDISDYEINVDSGVCTRLEN